MNLLQYTSKEMYSSTDLIRKSKGIFDKLNKKEIEKAIILRDGKPSFILLDFETYENIMIEYMQLKESKTQSPKNHQAKDLSDHEANVSRNYETIDEITKDKINDEDLQKALQEIEKLDFSISKVETKKETPLKEFWE